MMKENRNKIIMQPLIHPILITCPICGYSFNRFDSETKKENILCPICKYKFHSYYKFKISNLILPDMIYSLKLQI